MGSLIEGRLPLARSGELLEELLLLEADAWSADSARCEPAEWKFGNREFVDRLRQQAASPAWFWDPASNDVWLKHPHAAHLDNSTAVLVYEAEVTIDDTVSTFLTSTVFTRRQHEWQPALRHLGAAEQ